MPNDLRDRIEAVLTENDGICLDNDDERRQLADQLVSALTDIDLYLVARVHAGRVEEIRVYADPEQAAKELMKM